MKNIFLNFFLVFGVGIIFSSCENSEIQEYGEALLYIPQAVVQNGGLNNNYNIILSNSTNSDTAIAIGLYRSGLQKLERVSVELEIDTDTVNNAVLKSSMYSGYEIYKNSLLLSQEYYNLPTGITLKDGERDTWVELNLEKSRLLSQWPASVERYILPVRIKNPTKYKLNSKLSIVMLIFERD